MILLCGIPSEPPMARVLAQVERMELPHLFFNQRHFKSARIAYELRDGTLTGTLALEGREHALEDIRGVYTRLMDEQLLPELRGEPPGSEAHRHCARLHEVLRSWCELAPYRVVNRNGPMESNASKPYQTQLIRECGFLIPETLITNDPEQVLDFRERKGRIVFKSISGVRSIVRQLQEEDLTRLHRIRWCPVQFQEFIDGTNIRVHVVGNEVFATAITTDVTDYRYARKQGASHLEFEPVELPEELAERCVRLAATLELPLAGIDLKRDGEGRVFCFEVNPSPAFSYFEENAGQPISEAIARYLWRGPIFEPWY